MQGRTLMLNERIKSTGDLERALILVERSLLNCPNEVPPVCISSPKPQAVEWLMFVGLGAPHNSPLVAFYCQVTSC